MINTTETIMSNATQTIQANFDKATTLTAVLSERLPKGSMDRNLVDMLNDILLSLSEQVDGRLLADQPIWNESQT